MDVFQSTRTLIQSGRTLAQSVSTPLIITHDCCDLVSTPRQLELCLRTISYRALEWGRRKAGSEGKSLESEGMVMEEARGRTGGKTQENQRTMVWLQLLVFTALMWFIWAGENNGSKLRWLQTTTIRHLIMHLLGLAVFQDDQSKAQLVGLMRIQMGKTLQEKVFGCQIWKVSGTFVKEWMQLLQRIFHNLIILW